MRSSLWATENKPTDLPSPGQILKEIQNGDFNAEAYDSDWPERYKKDLW